MTCSRRSMCFHFVVALLHQLYAVLHEVEALHQNEPQERTAEQSSRHVEM